MELRGVDLDVSGMRERRAVKQDTAPFDAAEAGLLEWIAVGRMKVDAYVCRKSIGYIEDNLPSAIGERLGLPANCSKACGASLYRDFF